MSRDENPLIVFGAVDVRKSLSPIDLAHLLYSSLYQRTSCDENIGINVNNAYVRCSEASMCQQPVSEQWKMWRQHQEKHLHLHVQTAVFRQKLRKA